MFGFYKPGMVRMEIILATEWDSRKILTSLSREWTSMAITWPWPLGFILPWVHPVPFDIAHDFLNYSLIAHLSTFAHVNPPFWDS